MKEKLEVGTRIFYHGDMANEQGFGTITKVSPVTEYRSESVIIEFDDGRKQNIEISYFDDEYKGNASTKYVTLEAYKKFREDFVKRISKELNKNYQ